jgi:hypothetical protein
MHSNELRQAWERASFFQDAGAGLEYWIEELGNQPQLRAPSGSRSAPEELVEDDEELDEELAEALRISREHLELLTPPSPPPGQHPRLDDDTDDDKNDHHTWPPKLRFPSISKRSYDPDHHEGRRPSSPTGLHHNEPPRKHARIDHPSAERRNAESTTKQKRRIPATLDELASTVTLPRLSAISLTAICKIHFLTYLNSCNNEQFAKQRLCSRSYWA